MYSKDNNLKWADSSKPFGFPKILLQFGLFQIYRKYDLQQCLLMVNNYYNIQKSCLEQHWHWYHGSRFLFLHPHVFAQLAAQAVEKNLMEFTTTFQVFASYDHTNSILSSPDLQEYTAPAFSK